MSDTSMNDEVETEIDAEAEIVDAEIEAGAEALGDEDEPPLFDRREGTGRNRHKRAIFGVPIQVVISVGKASPSIGEVLNMRRDSLLPLDSKLDDPVEIMVGKRVIARGELQELEDGEGRLGVRLTEIVDLSEPF